MTLIELANQVKRTREAQSRYFSKRDNLEVCKALERALDETLARVLAPGLFDVAPMIGAGEIIEIAGKLRTAQRLAVVPADYDCQHEAQTAAIYSEQLDEAIALYRQQEAGQ